MSAVLGSRSGVMNTKYTHSLDEAVQWVTSTRSGRNLDPEKAREVIEEACWSVEVDASRPLLTGFILRYCGEAEEFYDTKSVFKKVSEHLGLTCVVCEEPAQRFEKGSFEFDSYHRRMVWRSAWRYFLRDVGRCSSFPIDYAIPFCKTCQRRFFYFASNREFREADHEQEEWLITAWLAKRLQRFRSENAA